MNKEEKSRRDAKKAELIASIGALAKLITAVDKVPARILAASHQQAVEWKQAIAAAKNEYYVRYNPGTRVSIDKLAEANARLASLYQRII